MPNEHRCSQCHAKYPNASRLQRHLETHMITGDWLCGLCNTLCNRSAALRDHWQVSCPEMKMFFCDDERKAMAGDDLQEAAYRLTLDRYSSLNNYEEAGPSNMYYVDEKSITSLCIYCNLHLPRGTLNTHYGVHTNQHRPGRICPNSIVSYVCDLCGYGFRYKKSLYSHWRYRCTELLTHCPPLGLTIDNRQLKKMVESLVKQAEVTIPFEILKKNREDETEKQYGEEDDNEDEETKPSYTSRINPPTIRDRHSWNVGNHLDHQHCIHCNRDFHSLGRLDRHNEVFHQNRKQYFQCELCQTKFHENRCLLRHLRSNCKAMRVEEPDDIRRKNMSREEILQVVEHGKQKWIDLHENKKEANLKFITQFLEELDRKRPRRIEKETKSTILDVPMPISGFVPDCASEVTVCTVCKIKFKSPRFLVQHQHLVHGYKQPNTSRNQLTITASSLLPFFKLQEAVFFDLDGNEYRIGKYLEKGKDMARHLKERIIRPGTKLPKNDDKDFFVVELIGSGGQHILLNQEEFPDVCSTDGKLKRLFSENPREFDDIPELIKQI